MGSIVIVNWNGREFLRECLEGLRRQVYRDFSVILVDNGSRDGSAAFVSENYPEVVTPVKTGVQLACKSLELLDSLPSPE